jgi:hypothetical protein
VKKAQKKSPLVALGLDPTAFPKGPEGAFVARAPHHFWAGRPTTFHWLAMFFCILIGLLFSRSFFFLVSSLGLGFGFVTSWPLDKLVFVFGLSMPSYLF